LGNISPSKIDKGSDFRQYKIMLFKISHSDDYEREPEIYHVQLPKEIHNGKRLECAQIIGVGGKHESGDSKKIMITYKRSLKIGENQPITCFATAHKNQEKAKEFIPVKMVPKYHIEFPELIYACPNARELTI
jgi:hypothetical protein